MRASKIKAQDDLARGVVLLAQHEVITELILENGELKRERDEARAERDVFRDALEYIGACGLSARHLKDYAIEVLPKEAAK